MRESDQTFPTFLLVTPGRPHGRSTGARSAYRATNCRFGGRGGDDREFLAIVRAPQKERARLKRISAEFERALDSLATFGIGLSLAKLTPFFYSPFNKRYPYEYIRPEGP